VPHWYAGWPGHAVHEIGAGGATGGRGAVRAVVDVVVGDDDGVVEQAASPRTTAASTHHVAPGRPPAGAAGARPEPAARRSRAPGTDGWWGRIGPERTSATRPAGAVAAEC
jgi:hypothetical protein